MWFQAGWFRPDFPADVREGRIKFWRIRRTTARLSLICKLALLIERRRGPSAVQLDLPEKLRLLAVGSSFGLSQKIGKVGQPI